MKLRGLVPNSFICERSIYTQDRSQIHECGNREREHNNSFLEITRPRSFISGNTYIGTRYLYWILTGPSFAQCNLIHYSTVCVLYYLYSVKIILLIVFTILCVQLLLIVLTILCVQLCAIMYVLIYFLSTFSPYILYKKCMYTRPCTVCPEM